jgi:cysteine desulfurase
VLSAIGVSPDLASSAIRMSIGALTTDACIERVASVFPALVAKARGMPANAAPPGRAG